MTGSSDPRRGEIWLTSFGAGRRGEPGKNRPAVVVSVDEILAGEEHELIVVVPLSSSSAPSALRPEIGPEAGIDSDSAAVCRGVRGVSRPRLLRRLGEAPADQMQKVERALALLLGFG